MKERRSLHQTQWAAQFAVASELCKRGYQVALTMGNQPVVDLMVISPSGKSFKIDVKGMYKKNFWVVYEKAALEGLYYVLAYVPDKEQNRFFVLTQNQVHEQIRNEKNATAARAIAKGKSTEKAGLFPGVSWKFAEQWENKWEDILPK